MGCVTRGYGLTVSSSLHSAQNQMRFGAYGLGCQQGCAGACDMVAFSFDGGTL